jgi:hypothetical protein
LKAYIDVFNEHGHRGFSEPVNPFQFYDRDDIRFFIEDGLVVVLEVSGRDVLNLMVFALKRHRDTLRKILDILKKYDTVILNSESRDRYGSIINRLDGSRFRKNGRWYYTANGGHAWAKLYGWP